MTTNEPISGIGIGEELVFDDSLCGAKHPSEDDTTCAVPPEPNAFSPSIRAELEIVGFESWPEDPPYDVHVHEGRGLVSGVKHRWEDA